MDGHASKGLRLTLFTLPYKKGKFGYVPKRATVEAKANN